MTQATSQDYTAQERIEAMKRATSYSPEERLQAMKHAVQGSHTSKVACTASLMDACYVSADVAFAHCQSISELADRKVRSSSSQGRVSPRRSWRGAPRLAPIDVAHQGDDARAQKAHAVQHSRASPPEEVTVACTSPVGASTRSLSPMVRRVRSLSSIAPVATSMPIAVERQPSATQSLMAIVLNGSSEALSSSLSPSPRRDPFMARPPLSASSSEVPLPTHRSISPQSSPRRLQQLVVSTPRSSRGNHTPSPTPRSSGGWAEPANGNQQLVTTTKQHYPSCILESRAEDVRIKSFPGRMSSHRTTPSAPRPLPQVQSGCLTGAAGVDGVAPKSASPRWPGGPRRALGQLLRANRSWQALPHSDVEKRSNSGVQQRRQHKPAAQTSTGTPRSETFSSLPFPKSNSDVDLCRNLQLGASVQGQHVASVSGGIGPNVELTALLNGVDQDSCVQSGCVTVASGVDGVAPGSSSPRRPGGPRGALGGLLRANRSWQALPHSEFEGGSTSSSGVPPQQRGHGDQTFTGGACSETTSSWTLPQFNSDMDLRKNLRVGASVQGQHAVRASGGNPPNFELLGLLTGIVQDISVAVCRLSRGATPNKELLELMDSLEIKVQRLAERRPESARSRMCRTLSRADLDIRLARVANHSEDILSRLSIEVQTARAHLDRERSRLMAQMRSLASRYTGATAMNKIEVCAQIQERHTRVDKFSELVAGVEKLIQYAADDRGVFDDYG